MNQHDTENLLGGLRALAREESALGAPSRLEAALLSEFRRRGKYRMLRRALLCGAAAAGLAAAIWLRPGPPPVAGSPAAKSAAPPPTVSVSARAEPAAAPRVSPSAARAPRPASHPPGFLSPAAAAALRRPSPRAEVSAPASVPVAVFATEFLRVPGADPFEPLDRGRLLRVQLPRSALEVFGLPLNESRWSERVQADVVLSEDGMVRAVRFVQ